MELTKDEAILLHRLLRHHIAGDLGARLFSVADKIAEEIGAACLHKLNIARCTVGDRH